MNTKLFGRYHTISMRGLRAAVSALLCLTLCCTLCGCGKYAKRDVFSLIDDLNRMGGPQTRTEDILYRDEVYYMTVTAENGARCLLTVSADAYDIPRSLRLLFTASNPPPVEEAAAMATACLSAFSGVARDDCAQMLESLGAFDAARYFTAENRERQQNGYRLSMTSTPLFTALVFTPEKETE